MTAYRVLWDLKLFNDPGFCPAPLIQNYISTFPHISDSWVGKWADIKAGVARNGGIPQLTDFDAHREAFAVEAKNRKPPNYSGMFCIDFESYWPIVKWNKEYSSLWQKYGDASLEWCVKNFPNANKEFWKLEAEQSFEHTAIIAMVEAVRGVKESCPKAKVGFYNFPRRRYYNGYNGATNDLTLGNDRLAPLWSEIDVLMPSLYLFYKDDALAKPVAINALAECQRLKLTYNKKLSIYPFIMLRYHNSGDYPALLTPEDLEISLALPLDHGANGVILWGNETTAEGIEQMKKYILDQVVPLALDIY